VRPTAATGSGGQPGHMTSNAHSAQNTSTAISRFRRSISPVLSVTAGGLVGLGIVTGFVQYLQRSPIKEVRVPGTSAWDQQLLVAAGASALYGTAVWRRRFGRGSGRPLLLNPLGRTAASRLIATLRSASWRSAAALVPLTVMAYTFWRIGEQVTAGLDPDFTVNAWGGPSYLGAMACHYLDCALILGVSAWRLDRILRPAAAVGTSAAVRPAGRVGAGSP
jgi:hypothetical protein